MSEPVILLEQSYRGHQWRIAIVTYKGREALSIWPFYYAVGGELRPGRGGLQLPIERAGELLEALRVVGAAKAQPSL